MPDKRKINKLVKFFDITLEEFYLGEKKEKIRKYNHLYLNIKNKKLIILVLFMLLLIIIILSVINLDNKTKNIYKILSDSTHYSGVGNIFMNNKRNTITLTNLFILNEEDLLIGSACFEYYVMIEDELILHNGDVYSCDNSNNFILLGDYVKEIQVNINDDLNYTIMKNDIANKKLNITINYLNEDNEIKSYIMYFDIVEY